MDDLEKPDEEESLEEMIMKLSLISSESLTASKALLELKLYDFNPEILDNTYQDIFESYKTMVLILSNPLPEYLEQIRRITDNFVCCLNNLAELTVLAAFKGEF